MNPRLCPVLVATTLLMGCPRGAPTISSNGLIYSRTARGVDLQVQDSAPADCLVLDHPDVAALMPDQPSEAFALFEGDLLSPWDEQIWELESRCWVGRVQAEGQTATMVFDAEVFTTVVEPVQLESLFENVLLVELDEDPSFRSADPRQLAPSTGMPACASTAPSWTGRSTQGTLLQIEHQQGCTVFTLEAGVVSVCNAPVLPYLIGEDLQIEISPTLFSAQTLAGGKPVLLSRDVEHLPSGLDLFLFRDDPLHTIELRADPCWMPSSCSPAVSVELILRSDGSKQIGWGEHQIIIDPTTGSRRSLTLHQAGTPIDPSCGIEVAYSIVPAPPP